MSEQSPPIEDVATTEDNADTAVPPSSDLDPVSPESLNSDSNLEKGNSEETVDAGSTNTAVTIEGENSNQNANNSEDETSQAPDAVESTPAESSDNAVVSDAEEMEVDAGKPAADDDQPEDVDMDDVAAGTNAELLIEPTKETETSETNEEAIQEDTKEEDLSKPNEDAIHEDMQKEDGDTHKGVATSHDDEESSKIDEDAPKEDVDLAKITVRVDDSVMEHDPEQVNCSELDDTLKGNKSMTEDPFDLVKSTSTETENAPQDANNTSVTDNVGDISMADDAEGLDDNADTSLNGLGESESREDAPTEGTLYNISAHVC